VADQENNNYWNKYLIAEIINKNKI